MQSITNKMAKGAAWMVAFKMIERSIGLLSTIILARLLEPDDFGLVAMATAFLGLLLLLTSFSFDVALIQKQEPDRALYDTAWTFNVIFGALLAIILAVAAGPLVGFYNEPRLEDILYILAFGTFLGGFGNIGPVAFRKDLQFHKEFYFLLGKKISGFIVCMILAFSMRNYWALVFGTFASTIAELALSYAVHSYRPRFCLKGRKELFGYSMWLFINNTIFFTYHRMADFIISKTLGSHTLGVYTVAYELSNLPTTELVAPINRAVFPGYSKLANNPDDIRHGFLSVLGMIALCAIPAGLGIALVADVLVPVVLGNKWLESVPLIQMLAMSGVFVALQTNTGSLYMAIGKPSYLTMISLFHVFVVFIPLFLYLMELNGVFGVTQAYLFSNIIIWPINFFVVSSVIKLKWRSIFFVLWRPIIGCFVMTAVLRSDWISMFSGLLELDWLCLVFKVFIGVVVYSFTVLLCWFVFRKPEGAEKTIVNRLFYSPN
ncbi:lipopolysaccharide biosynthesis protein [Methylomonas sp. SURF-2]|uniref:Lipopolysaccharide biosynthesis protein n=1 Tax=Methylomonas subterranea TaxID=2952225 RepID=A0ABT1TCV7_9GAMM|nr:lipopolysaccharide biosynthesis protein [Methylomonas sp. SURF-2]MCQ8103098.1 lipopolysaccharide biosynthesis protein [Methylomonas sp. SURF-2]